LTERRYKNYSPERLFAEKQATRDALAKEKRELAAFERRVRRLHSQSPLPLTAYYDEDYEAISRHIESLSKELSEIEGELFTRSQQSSGAPGSRGASRNLVTVACDCRPPRRFKVTGTAYDGGPIICGNCNQQFGLA
jgi:hypothetical protein